MKITNALIIFNALLCIVLVGCASETLTPTSGPTVTQVLVEPPALPSPTISPTPTDVTEDPPTTTPEPDIPDETEEVTDVPVQETCVECHSDQQSLIDTAKPQEEVVSENEGEG